MTKIIGKVAILLSGRGSNFEAIYRDSLKTGSNYKIVVVITDKRKAKGFETANQLNIPAFYVKPKDFPSKGDYEKHLISIFEKYGVNLICLAGFMRIISGVMIGQYRNRIINIHPSLLPAFPGLNAQKQALDSGATESGCTVHFVDEGMDSGPVIMQRKVQIIRGDSVESLSARILKEEHKLYPEVIRLFFYGKLKIKQRKVKILK